MAYSRTKELLGNILYVSPTQLTGAGTINTRGLLSDINLVFDVADDLNQAVQLNGSGQDITINLDLTHYQNDNNGDLGVGYKGSGSLSIGTPVVSRVGYLGFYAGSTGEATIAGTHAHWVNRSMIVGYGGNGALNITSGGGINSSMSSSIGDSSSSSGTVTVDGDDSNWSNTDDLHIGKSGSASLTISGGGTVGNTFGYIGYYSGSTGEVTVTGTGSTGTASFWNNRSDLYVGRSGSGQMNVTGGGAVENRVGYIGSNAGSDGVVTVDGTNSTWTNRSELYVGQAGTGTLAVTDGGTVEVANGPCYVGYAVNSNGVVTVSDPNSRCSSCSLGVGYLGQGTMNVLGGGHVVTAHYGYIGLRSGSMGKVTVSNPGSKWNMIAESANVYVGYQGTGQLRISDSGVVENEFAYIGYDPGSIGEVIVDNAGSQWNSWALAVGQSGTGKLTIANGATVGSTAGRIGRNSGSTGEVIVAGAGSQWNSGSALYVGDSGTGRLTINNGGAVTSGGASINSQSLLAIDVENGSLLSIGSGNGTITNNGTVCILAGAGAAATTYTPISAKTFTNNGAWQAVGGIWDTDTHQFTVLDAITGSSGTEIEDINLASTQRVLVSDGKGWSVGASFLEQSCTIDFMARAISDTTLTSLESRLATGDSVLSGWEFLADNYADNYTVSETNPVYLSLNVGSGHSLDDLDLWHYTLDDGWQPYTAWDLTYDGTYTSFTVTGFSSYAVSGLAVPEPSVLVLLSIGAASLLAWRWQQRK